MKYASVFAMLFIMVFAGSALWACGCSAPQAAASYVCPPMAAGPCAVPPVAQCPCAAPVVAAAPCETPPPCLQACPNACCSASVPGAIGAGPAPGLAALQCPDFDPAYASRIIQQNNVIIAVAEVGTQRATDRNLRNISGDVRQRLMGANDKIATKYGLCAPLPTDDARAQAIIAGLCGEGDCFDMAYAKTLSELVHQSGSADELAGTRAVTPTLHKQAQFMTGQESDWGFRLDRWVTDHGCPT